MNRISYLAALTSLCFLNFIGCKPNLDAGVDVANATLVTFDQLKEVTKDKEVFRWLGCDDEFQYFRTEKGFYRMTTSSVVSAGIWDKNRIRDAKKRFESGEEIGETSQVVMIRDNKIGLPVKGSKPPLFD